MKKAKTRTGLRIDVELNSKLIQIAEHEDVSKNKLVEKELKRFADSWERQHKDDEVKNAITRY